MLQKRTPKFGICHWSPPHSRGGIDTKSNLATFLLLLVVLTFVQASVSDGTGRVYRVRSSSTPKLHNRTTKKCLAERDPEVRMMADQICELCHEMFSHVNPNLRAECSSQCYKNAQFRKCLEMYTALPEGHPGGTAETKRNDARAEQGKPWAGGIRNLLGGSRRGADNTLVGIRKYL